MDITYEPLVSATNVNKVNLVMAADLGAFPQTATVIASVIRRSSRPVSARIYLRGLCESSFSTERLTVEFITVSEQFPGSYPAHVSASTFDRLLAIRDCDDWDRALVLDYDQLVLADIAELYDVDFQGSLVASRPCDITIRTAASRWFYRQLPEAYENYYQHNLLTFGLMLNLAQMRVEHFWEKLLAIHHDFEFEEQLSLAVAVESRVKPLEPKWNLIPNWDLLEQTGPIEGILHWCAQPKPWNGEGWRPHIWKAEETSWDELREGRLGRSSKGDAFPGISCLQQVEWRKQTPVTLRSGERRRAHPINLVLAATIQQFPFLSTVIASVLRRTERQVSVRVLLRGQTEADFEAEQLSVRFLTVEQDYLTRALPKEKIPAYDRLLAIDRFRDWNRALLLSCCQLVLCDPGDLFDLPFRQALLAARMWKDSVGEAARHWHNRPLPEKYAPYGGYRVFVQGPLLNLQGMRDQETWQRFLRIDEELEMDDQIALSIAVKSRTIRLGTKWNKIPSVDSLDMEAPNPFVVQWIGEAMPWNGHGWNPALWYAEETSWDDLRSGCWHRNELEPIRPVVSTENALKRI